jgi:hypothetical protein
MENMARRKNPKKPPVRKRTTAVSEDTRVCDVGAPALDLATIEAADPSVAVALRRFEHLRRQHKATERDFFDLVRLLHRVGCSTEAEYLLRCHLLVAADERSPYEDDKGRLALYTELFGPGKQEELTAAIAAFSNQFSAKLTRGAGTTFWIGYHTVPRSACFTKYRIRNEPCYVRFEYEKRNTIEAWLECLSDEDQLVVLRYANGVWEIIGKGIPTKVYDGDGPE